MNNGTGFHKSKKLRIFQKTRGHCGYCGVAMEPHGFPIDHIHPKCNGGSDDDANLLLACPSCNSRKCKKSLNDFRLFESVRVATGGETVFGQAQILYLQGAGLLPALGVDPNFQFFFEREVTA